MIDKARKLAQQTKHKGQKSSAKFAICIKFVRNQLIMVWLI